MQTIADWTMYQRVIESAHTYGENAAGWHKDADIVAVRSPRLAARMRDVALAIGALAHLCNDLKRELDK